MRCCPGREVVVGTFFTGDPGDGGWWEVTMVMMGEVQYLLMGVGVGVGEVHDGLVGIVDGKGGTCFAI